MKTKQCQVAGCSGGTYRLRKGLCAKHYTRQYRHGSVDWEPQSDEERFWQLVPKTDGCWVWAGCVEATGYGVFHKDDKKLKAHRMCYEFLVGPIPEGLHMDHLCRNRQCVNPAHLEPVTCGENVRRGISPAAANARRTKCSKGHPFSGENLELRSDGGRRCKTCRRETQRRYDARRRAK